MPILEVLVLLIPIFAAGLFLLFGGPLWLASSAKVFARGPEAPRWLRWATVWVSRLVGIWTLVMSLSLLVKLLI